MHLHQTYIKYNQLHNALREFDFLQNLQNDSLEELQDYETHGGNHMHQMSLGVDLLRPVLSMPPVILMGDGRMGSFSSSSHNRLLMNSVPPSPIVEMPPSPAPSQMPVVEFPIEEDVYEYDDNEYVVEVRTQLFF